MVLGLVFNLVLSLITGVLGTLPWLIIITLIASYVSLYLFGPWLTRRGLETQRKHLLASLSDFYQANIQITILAPMKEERVQRLKAKRSRTRLG
jgi:membrane protein implicated in regulation of membrane protease activity